MNSRVFVKEGACAGAAAGDCCVAEGREYAGAKRESARTASAVRSVAEQFIFVRYEGRRDVRTNRNPWRVFASIGTSHRESRIMDARHDCDHSTPSAGVRSALFSGTRNGVSLSCGESESSTRKSTAATSATIAIPNSAVGYP